MSALAFDPWNKTADSTDLLPEERRQAAQSPAAVVTLADVKPERISWLWFARLPAAKLAVFDGDPGVGKSTLAVDMAAHVSTGQPWPDGGPCPLGDVLVLSAEDGLADTIRPRLDAAGGDPARVHALTGVNYVDDDGTPGERPVTLADVEVIADAVRRFGVRLVVVDVLMAYLPGSVDSHRDQDVRGVLARLTRMAEDTGACILLLRHLNKTTGSNPLYRGGGSIGIVGAARVGLLAAVDPDDETRRVLAVTKCNLAPEPPALAYRLQGADNGVARVQWCGESTASAATLLASPSGEDERSERDEAVEWLDGFLEEHGGEVRAGDAIKAAKADGIAERTLQRARKRAGIASVKAGLHGGWVWQLGVPRRQEGAEDASSQDLAPTAPSVSPSPVCVVCGGPLDAAVAAGGFDTHPACDLVVTS